MRRLKNVQPAQNYIPNKDVAKETELSVPEMKKKWQETPLMISYFSYYIK